jgi:hypothetical protein
MCPRSRLAVQVTRSALLGTQDLDQRSIRRRAFDMVAHENIDGASPWDSRFEQPVRLVISCVLCAVLLLIDRLALLRCYSRVNDYPETERQASAGGLRTFCGAVKLFVEVTGIRSDAF